MITTSTRLAELRAIGWTIERRGNGYVARKGYDFGAFNRGTSEENLVNAVTYAGITQEFRDAERRDGERLFDHSRDTRPSELEAL
jgi:hypothetical protein